MMKQNPSAQKKRRFLSIIMILTLLGLALMLILKANKANIFLFYSPTDLIKINPSSSQQIHVGGLVKKNSISHHAQDTITSFVITDLKTELYVSYSGVLPQLFREGQGVVVQGYFINLSEFKATRVLAKHDENYMPKNIVDKLKESGKWKNIQKNNAKNIQSIGQ